MGTSSASCAKETLTDKNLDVICEQFIEESNPKSVKTPLQMKITHTFEVTGKASVTI